MRHIKSDSGACFPKDLKRDSIRNTNFSKEEIKLALENGFQPISLGESRLRTETAGLVACTTVNLGYEA